MHIEAHNSANEQGSAIEITQTSIVQQNNIYIHIQIQEYKALVLLMRTNSELLEERDNHRLIYALQNGPKHCLSQKAQISPGR